MARDYVCLYHSYLDAMEALGDAERGRLVTAMINYSQRREIGELSGNERYIWPMIRSQIDRDMESYKQKCETNKNNRQRTVTTDNDRQRPTTIVDKEKGKGEGEYISPSVSPPGEKPKRKRKVFVKPTVEEIAAYCAERNNGIDAQYFFDKQESVGWIVGKDKPMHDWKATIRTWERNERNRSQQQGVKAYDPYANFSWGG